MSLSNSRLSKRIMSRSTFKENKSMFTKKKHGYLCKEMTVWLKPRNHKYLNKQLEFRIVKPFGGKIIELRGRVISLSCFKCPKVTGKWVIGFPSRRSSSKVRRFPILGGRLWIWFPAIQTSNCTEGNADYGNSATTRQDNIDSPSKFKCLMRASRSIRSGTTLISLKLKSKTYG